MDPLEHDESLEHYPYKYPAYNWLCQHIFHGFQCYNLKKIGKLGSRKLRDFKKSDKLLTVAQLALM